MTRFFAILSRMRYIPRWALMRNTRQENLSEHSYDVAVLAHLLAELDNRRFGGQVSVERCVLAALYHDAPEIFTGDLPTPVKHGNTALHDAYRVVEQHAADRLLSYLPDDLRGGWAPYVREELRPEEAAVVKAADKLSALIKCIEEETQGNREFAAAKVATEASLRAMQMPCVDCFLTEFLPAYSLTLDEQERPL